MSEGLTYVVGDAVHPQRNGIKKHVIVHVCNNIGVWGGGFTAALDCSWFPAGREYRAWHGKWIAHRIGQPFVLGQVQFVHSGNEDLRIANMIGQNGIRGANNPTPISYAALRTCLETVALGLAGSHVAIDMPRIGAGLAGGDWNRIEAIVNDVLIVKAHFPVFVYDLPQK